MTVVQHPIDECCRHNVIAQDFAPLLKVLVGGQHCRCFFVSTAHQLEEQHSACVSDWQIADLIQERCAQRSSIYVERSDMWSRRTSASVLHGEAGECAPHIFRASEARG